MGQARLRGSAGQGLQELAAWCGADELQDLNGSHGLKTFRVRLIQFFQKLIDAFLELQGRRFGQGLPQGRLGEFT